MIHGTPPGDCASGPSLRILLWAQSVRNPAGSPSTEFSPTIEVGRKRKPIQDQFLQCPRRDNQPRHMNSDLKCTFSTPSSRSGTVQPPHVHTRSWAQIHRITQEAARLDIRRTPAFVDHPWLKPHYRHSECGSLFAMTYSSVLNSHFPNWKFVCAPPRRLSRTRAVVCQYAHKPEALLNTSWNF